MGARYEYGVCLHPMPCCLSGCFTASPRKQSTGGSLSPPSITSPELVHKSAQRLAAINPQREAALVALADEQDGEEAVAVARFARLPHNPKVAEASILVRDDYQGTGVGRKLMELLIAEARKSGLERLILLTHADNTAMIRLATGLGLPFKGRHAEGLYEIHLLLQPQSETKFEFISNG